MDELEKRLRAAFDERPEGGPVAQDLRRRVIAKAVRSRRRQRLLLRWTPALALLAIVFLGGGVVLTSREGGQNQPRPGPTASAPVVPRFGLLPMPALNPPQGLGGGDGGASATPYFGPAELHWAGRLPSVPPSAPVIRFPLPTEASADAYATGLGAGPAQSAPDGERQYPGPDDYRTYIRMHDPLAPPTRFTLSRGMQRGAPALDQTQAEAAAASELARLKLTPTWPSQVSATRTSGQGLNSPSWTEVLYARQVTLPGGLTALVMSNLGDPTGTTVRVEDGGRVDRIDGYLPAAEETASYPVVDPAKTVQAALSAPPTFASPSGPVPVVQLTQARLVYIEANAGGYGYLEPAYLFTGTFTQGGVLYEKRVLVPAIAAPALHA